MMQALTLIWDLILKGNILDKVGNIVKFLIELFNGIHNYTEKYAPFVNGTVKLVEKMGDFKKTITFTDLYDLRRQMIDFVEKLQIDKDKDFEMDLVRNIFVADEKYISAEAFEVFIDDNFPIKGLQKYLFAFKAVECYVKENGDDVQDRIINLMLEIAVNRFFKK